MADNPWVVPDRILRRILLLDNGCWYWTGPTNGYYPIASVGGHTKRLHRLFYMAFKRVISRAVELHHVCNNRRCVNPSHLQELTTEEHDQAHRPCGAPAYTERHGTNSCYQGGCRCGECKEAHRIANRKYLGVVVHGR